MRIALTRRTHITHVDGVNRFIAWLGEGLEKLGHEVLVVSWGYQEIGKEELPRWFADMHSLDKELRIEVLREKHSTGEPWLRVAWDWLVKGSRLLERTDVAVINGIVPIMFRSKVAINHGVIRAGWLHERVGKILYRTVDRVVCMSSKLAEELSRTGIKCNNIIPLPLKLKIFKPKPLSKRADIIVHVGVRPVKNPQVSIDALRILRERL